MAGALLLGHFGAGLAGTLAQGLEAIFVEGATAFLAGLLNQLLEGAAQALVGIGQGVTEATGQVDGPLVGTDGVAQALLVVVFEVEAVAGKAGKAHRQNQQQAVLHPQLADGAAEADGQGRHFPAVAGDGVVLDATHLMPEEQVAVVEGQGIPFLQVDLDLDLVAADLFDADQGWVDGG